MTKYLFYAAILYVAGCTGLANDTSSIPQLPSLPVVELNTAAITTFQDYPAAVQGAVNVEIRPQVSGYLEKIFVEDGAWVSRGQPLFRINASEYSQYSSGAAATIQLAKAAVEKAQLEVDKLQPLVAGNVVSEVQLKTAKANLHEAEAAYQQAVSGKRSADITVAYTLIGAPVSGYIGHINYKQGSLIGKGEAEPLTVLSEINDMHAYFSMSEADFLSFISRVKGATTEEKIKNIPPVSLILADNSEYQYKGRVELVQGQFDRSTGSIAFRAIFPNTERLLRSGITGKVRIPQIHDAALLVPQASTFEIQDKVFVFALGDSNKVISKPITVSGKTANYYFAENGVAAGDRIVFAGTGGIRDGMTIAPQALSMDSVIKSVPF